MNAQSHPILHQPLAQALQLADQRLMRQHLGAVLVQGDRRASASVLSTPRGLRRFFRLALQFGQGGAAAGILDSPFRPIRSGARTSPRHFLLRLVQLVGKNVLHGLGNRTAHTAGGTIAVHRQRSPAPPIPCRQQGVGERQGAGFGRAPLVRPDVMQQQVYQSRFKFPAPRRAGSSIAPQRSSAVVIWPMYSCWAATAWRSSGYSAQ